jgi:hypothetical protein
MAMADGDDTANVYPEDQQRICVRCLASYHFSVQTLIKEFTSNDPTTRSVVLLLQLLPTKASTLNMLESSFSSTFFIIIGMNQVSPTSNLE